MPASTITGSIPHMPTFCTPGTRAPIIIPIGSVASSPSVSTQTMVNQPPGCAIGLSKSRKLGTSTATVCGTMLAEWRTSCPAKLPDEAVRHRLGA